MRNIEKHRETQRIIETHRMQYFRFKWRSISNVAHSILLLSSTMPSGPSMTPDQNRCAYLGFRCFTGFDRADKEKERIRHASDTP